MNYKLRNIYSKNPDQALRDILIDRGVKDIDKFLWPSTECELNPYDLNNIKEGAELLLKHLRANHNILCIIDSDTDGFTSSSILWLYIKHIFPQAKLDFMLHEHKQHGMDDKIEEIENNPIYQLVICPDSSSYQIHEQNILNELGIDCLILDHHNQEFDENGQPILPNTPNVILINNQLSNNYMNKSLCGAGVVYKFCEVLDDILGIKQAQEYLDLVSLGEIADVMNRTNTETNYLMMEGLQCITNKGFQTLIEAQSYSLKEKAKWPYQGLTPIDIAFYIAPLINSITRVGTMDDKEALFYCFIEPEHLLPSSKRGAKEGETELAAEKAARVGKNAKSRQDKLKEKAIDLIDFKIQKNELDNNNVIIVEIDEEDDIPSELSGLVAMAIVSKYNKPCLILRRNENDLLQGSARTNNNFAELSKFKTYLENSNYFDYVAGHEGAFGAGIKANQVESFLNYVNKNLSSEAFENCYLVDYVLDANENNYDLITELSKHPEYFGNQIDEIKFVIINIPLQNILLMGPNKDSVKISYKNIDYVRFKDSNFASEIINHRMNKIKVYGRGNINTFNGVTSTQIFIDDYEFIIDSSKYEF